MLNRLAGQIEFTHLEASKLIKAEQVRRSITAQSSEALRTGPVLDNQALLIAGFENEAASISGNIVFDGHSLIDGNSGLIEIPVEVFAALDLDAICVLHAEPADILAHRLRDGTRQRPLRSIEELSEHQARAIYVARAIALQLNYPFELLCLGEESKLVALIRGYG